MRKRGGNKEVNRRKEVIRGCHRDHDEVGHKYEKEEEAKGRRSMQENSF